ncbi:MAG: TetR family transcriptional regulator [Hyphomonas sp.]|uniref:TetR/AcrR family transcriptional regulator n=1 Tax=Hyphomonas sp. TaxID=87 RepID=UPI003527B171
MAGPVAEKPENPRSIRTRQSLVAAGLQLFAERPVDAVPIDDIVAAAGVAKGSFFNHFEDKQKFADAIGAEIRMDLEARVSAANRHLEDPLQRLTGGMRVAVDYTLTEKERSIVMTRGFRLMTGRDHPLNSGLRKDIDAASAQGLVRKEAETTGLLFWLGACHSLMASVIELRLSRRKAAALMQDMMFMALLGLGVSEKQARGLADESAAMLLVAPAKAS